MGLYARYLLPRLTHLSMGQKQLLPYRQRVVTGAAGRVLEIGIGSGLNLPLYGDAVEEVIGIDISPELLAMAERAAAMVSRRRLRVRLLEGSAERLPCIIADGSVDTVVVTWALCSVPDATAALAEAHRVLRPRWVASVRRTRTVARYLSGLVAGPSHPAVEALFGRLSSESADRRPAAIGGVQACPAEDRLCAGAAADDVHV
jgi:ubiquinone/menaquinone biosynthesis C-methylase UbiE